MTGAPGFDDVVVGRRSIRGFLDKPVSKALIAEILGVAMRAPSSFNNQCWNFSVVTGEPLRLHPEQGQDRAEPCGEQPDVGQRDRGHP